jgi:hypothetical protein
MEMNNATPRDPLSNRPPLPDVFIDGVPCVRTRIGTDEDGKPAYVSIPIAVPTDEPSHYWREGC